jgi:3-methyl-2-oxobutanoate hydroxymethyltransferase
MAPKESKVTIPALAQMKRDGRKIVGVVAWDYQIAQIADRAGADMVSVGDSVGVNLWGQPSEGEVTMDEILVVCKAVRRGVKRALVSCDLPSGLARQGTDAALRAAARLVKDGGADMIKLDGAEEVPDTVRAIARAGIPVFAEFHGGPKAAEMTAKLVDQAKLLEQAGAALLDFRYSGPVAGPAVVRAVAIPVIGGLGGGPWLDGRMRMAHAAIGYAANMLESKTETYANVAKITLDALTSYAEDVRAGRHLKGQRPA